MRVMVLLKSTPQLESGGIESEAQRAAMDAYNEALANAGIRLDAQGLYPSSEGFRIDFTGDSTTVTDGPFAETKELLRGFWIWAVASMEDAITWAQRAPLGEGEQIELRRIYDNADADEPIAQGLSETIPSGI